MKTNSLAKRGTTPPRDHPKSRGPKDKVRIRIVLFPFTPFTGRWRWQRLRHEDFDVYTILFVFKLAPFKGYEWEWDKLK